MQAYVRVLAGMCWAKDGAKPQTFDQYFPHARKIFARYQQQTLLKKWEGDACRAQMEKWTGLGKTKVKSFGKTGHPLAKEQQCPMLQRFVSMHSVPSLFQELGYADAVARYSSFVRAFAKVVADACTIAGTGSNGMKWRRCIAGTLLVNGAC